MPRAGWAKRNEEPRCPARHAIATVLRINLGLLPSTHQNISAALQRYGAAGQAWRGPHLHAMGSRYVSLSSLT